MLQGPDMSVSQSVCERTQDRIMHGVDRLAHHLLSDMPSRIELGDMTRLVSMLANTRLNVKP